MPITKGYHLLGPDHSEMTDPEQDERARTRRRRSIFYVLYTILATTTVVLGILVGVSTSGIMPEPTKTDRVPAQALHCGESPTEAQALGCVFDLLTNNWLPEDCSDPYTDSEYRQWVYRAERRLGSFAFFHDESATRHIHTEDELSTLVGAHVYTTVENHLAHCAFLARRMHRLVTGEIAAVAHNTFAHTMHCTSALLESLEDQSKALQGRVEMSTFDVGIVSCAL